MNNLSEFTKLYPVSKTLRFELKPVGETLANIEANGIISEDEKRAEDYKRIKKVIDMYHKAFIEEALSNVTLRSLNDYYSLYTATPDEKKSQSWKTNFDKQKSNLRKELATYYSDGKLKDKYKNLAKADLIKKDLPTWIKENGLAEYEDLPEEFSKFTSYFTGFFENRKNMYSTDGKSTEIAYRVIDENLPKFIDNMIIFNSKLVGTELEEQFPVVYAACEPYLNVNSLADVFELSNFNNAISQKQIEAYNLVVGGMVTSDGKKIQGLNELINLYNQQHKDHKLPKLKMLYKQILSDREGISFAQEDFKTLDELLDSVKRYFADTILNGGTISTINLLFENIGSFDPSKVYVQNGKALTDLSQRFWGHYAFIKDALNYQVRNEEEAEKEKYLKTAYYSLSELNNALAVYSAEQLEEELNFIEKISEVKFDGITNILQDCINMLDISKEHLDKSNKSTLKTTMDSLLELDRFLKSFVVTDEKYSDKDELFYSDLEHLFDLVDEIVPLYNKVRNFLTKKPYSTEKIKLNFQSPQLANGWDKNKEQDCLAVILKKDELYYLGIMNAENKPKAVEWDTNDTGEVYQKMNYKLLPGPNKMLPKVFFSKKGIETFNPSKELLEKYNTGLHKKGAYFDVEFCHELIDFFKENIPKYPGWDTFGFQFSDTSGYKDISEFYSEISQQNYKISFNPISAEKINTMVKENKLYLFQIYNKDFSPYSHGKPNLHTMYWKALFSPENLENIVYKLNGEAEIFYRKKSLEIEKPTHPAGVPIAKKNPDLLGETSTFAYDLIKDKRYSVDKFMFHCPITMNYINKGQSDINIQVREYIKDNPNVNIIGIDRGERNLIYISLINQKGQVIKDANGNPIQYSLNEIISSYGAGEKEFKTDYHKLLDSKEKARAVARESWESIETIKELKEGYISQVVHLITKLMVEYNAIVVMEDLNFGFKRGRFKVEKQVYQKFEKMLIDKLNYLVIKDKLPDEEAGLYHALQLSNKFESFQKMGKQMGFIFYVPAWDTSKIDPVTGFVNLFPKCKTVSDKQNFIKSFDSIRFVDDAFLFTFDYGNFTSRVNDSKTNWIISSQGDKRYSWNPKANDNKGQMEAVNVTAEMKRLLDEANIDYQNGRDIKDDISTRPGIFINPFYKLFTVLLAMRYSNADTGEDFILSPVPYAEGKYFDTRICDDSLPKDADANGAYNIARKGLWAIQQINETEDLNKVRLAIKNDEWLRYVQNQK